MTLLIIGKQASGKHTVIDMLAENGINPSGENTNDIKIVDPDELETLVNDHPNETYHIVYVSAKTECRKTRYLKNHIGTSDAVFDNTDKNKTTIFKDFEEKYAKTDDGVFPSNITAQYSIENNGTEETLRQDVNKLARWYRTTQNIKKIISELIDKNIINTDENGQPCVEPQPNETKLKGVSIDYMADMVASDPFHFNFMMSLWLSETDML